jgi:hypothetical protein
MSNRAARIAGCDHHGKVDLVEALALRLLRYELQVRSLNGYSRPV